MEPTDTIPAFLIFAFQGCVAPDLLGSTWPSQNTAQEVRPVTVPLIFMVTAAVAMLAAAGLWWREVKKGVPLVLIGIALISVLGFLGYHVSDFLDHSPTIESIFFGGNYFIAVGEFSFYLLGALMMIFVSLILVWREVGWDMERNLLFLATGATTLMAIFWYAFSVAVWNCV